MMRQSVEDAEAADSAVATKDAAPQRRTPAAGESTPSNARVDTESLAKEALLKAEGAMMAVELIDERRPRKGSIEDLKRELDRELGKD